MTDIVIERLRAENDVLRAEVTRLKEREAYMARGIATMLNTPSQSVASASYKDGEWECVMTTGHVWRRVQKVLHTETEHRYFEEWVPRPAVPGSRAAIAEQIDELEDAALPFHLLPGRIAS